MCGTSSLPLRVILWNEFIHERRDANVKAIYPDGMQAFWRKGLLEHLGSRVIVGDAHLEDEEHGLSEERLRGTDVLVWWGHAAHDAVDDVVLGRVVRRVWAGMGLIVLHSAHYSKIFRSLMGTSCRLRWRNEQDRELVWTVDPGHPIAQGVADPIEIFAHEMYGEAFDIPQPDELVFVSSFSGGEVFRSGCCFRRGRGRIFYFSPGDQDYPIYHMPEIQRVISNAVAWAAPAGVLKGDYAPGFSPKEWFRRSERGPDY